MLRQECNLSQTNSFPVRGVILQCASGGVPHSRDILRFDASQTHASAGDIHAYDSRAGVILAEHYRNARR